MNKIRLVLVVAVTVLVCTVASATAARLVTSAQIKNGTITSADVKNATLKIADLSGAARSRLAGKTGPTGPAGLDGVSGWEMIRETSTVISQGSANGVAAYCPAGKKITGAAANWDEGFDPIQVSIFEDGSTAVAHGENVRGVPSYIVLHVFCASAL